MTKHQASILIVDDDPAIISSARLFLKQKFEFVLGIKDPNMVIKTMSESYFDVVLLDMNYRAGDSSGNHGLQLITEIIQEHPNTEVIPITAYGEIDLAVKALQRGARDFITKPWQNEKLYTTIINLLKIRNTSDQVNLLKDLNTQLQNDKQTTLIGCSPNFLKVVDTINKVASTDANVLILGENGVGKEVVANQIYAQSDRKNKPFIKVDLGAISENLFESELFGHVKGAFTDASLDKKGRFEIANGGTVFLDEIGNTSIVNQAKLLSVIQNMKVTPVGANKSISIDVRVICATNSNLEEKVIQGVFRQDLLFRINTIVLEVPPLSERKEDIELLARHYLEIYKIKYQKPALKINGDAFKALKVYKWPGNVRELDHTIERCVILSTGSSITPADLNLQVSHVYDETDSLNIDEMEKVLILKSLKKNNGNITHAARDLGIDRQALYRRLEKHGL